MKQIFKILVGCSLGLFLLSLLFFLGRQTFAGKFYLIAGLNISLILIFVALILLIFPLVLPSTKKYGLLTKAEDEALKLRMGCRKIVEAYFPRGYVRGRLEDIKKWKHVSKIIFEKMYESIDRMAEMYGLSSEYKSRILKVFREVLGEDPLVKRAMSYLRK